MKRNSPAAFATWGSVRLPIHHTPHKIKVETDQKSSPGTQPSEPAVKVYDSYQVAYYENGKRRWLRAPTLKQAIERGKALAKTLGLEGSETIKLPQGEQRIYVAARNILQKHNLAVDEGARLLDSVLARLDPTFLRQAVDFFLAHTLLVHSKAISAQARLGTLFYQGREIAAAART